MTWHSCQLTCLVHYLWKKNLRSLNSDPVAHTHICKEIELKFVCTAWHLQSFSFYLWVFILSPLAILLELICKATSLCQQAAEKQVIYYSLHYLCFHHIQNTLFSSIVIGFCCIFHGRNNSDKHLVASKTG